MTALLQLLISGVLLGGIYALAAFGLALIFGVCNILNLAHGEFLMLGALVCFLLVQSLGIDPFVSILVLLPLFFVLGMLFERALLRTVAAKTGHEQLTASVLVTLGLSLCIEDVARLLWGAEEKGFYYSLPPIVLGQGAIVISSVRLLALSFDIVGGYTGYMNLGHAAFFGLGAYVFGMCVQAGMSVLLAGGAAILLTALFAALISYPFFRLRGPYYALATFGLLKLCEELALTLSGLTGGSGGLSVVWPENLTLSYFLNLGLAGGTFLTVWLVTRSRFGLGLVSIREDEQVARAFGVSVVWYKCAALVVSALPAAALGPVYLSDRLYINPGEMFGLETALMPITMAILGGSGLLIGPLVGVAFLSLLQEVVWTQFGMLRLASLGLVLALVGLFMPGGLVRLPPVYTRLCRWGLVQEG